jgi:hypothetical protein
VGNLPQSIAVTERKRQAACLGLASREGPPAAAQPGAERGPGGTFHDHDR